MNPEFWVDRFAVIVNRAPGDLQLFANSGSEDLRVTRVAISSSRPEMADLVRTFATSVHSYPLRLRMKPGMTGWAAVRGFRGNTSLQERIDHDLDYIQNWSLGLDFRILFITLPPVAKCFGCRGIYKL